MIPESIIKYLAQDGDVVLRKDALQAFQALMQMEIDKESEFGEFYTRYRGGFISSEPRPELLDIAGPAIPAIPDQTAYVLDRYELPEEFVALTSDESEGMYLYNKNNKSVYDFSVGQSQDLINGKIQPRWNSFNEFLEWFFVI